MVKLTIQEAAQYSTLSNILLLPPEVKYYSLQTLLRYQFILTLHMRE